MTPTSHLLAGAALLTASAWAPAVHAAPPADVPALYSHAIPLQVSGKQAVVQWRLPADVYRHARTPDLADLRVFDSAGTPQPFALTRTAPPPRAHAADVPAAIFPIFGPRLQDGQIDNLQVRLTRDGTVVSVTPRAGASSADARALAGLVLDLGPLPDGAVVSSLTLTLPPTTRHYSATLAADASDNLQDWQPLAETTVSWLVNGRGDSVSSNRIAFAPQRFRYARLRWVDGEPLEFAAITAHTSTTGDAPQRWDSITLQPQPASGSADLVYGAPIAVPAERAGITLHEKNAVLAASIGHYVDVPGKVPGQVTVPEFRPLASATFYRLVQDGRERVAGDIAIPETHLAQWVVRPRAQLASPVDLTLRWRPATLVFVAGGVPPYSVTFGRPGATPAQLPLGQVAPGFSEKDLERLETATAGALVERRGNAPGAADESPVGAAHRKILWLWGLLLAGVGLLAWMAWRLVTQLKGDGTKGSD